MPSAQDCAERLREQAYRTLLPQIRDLEQELQNVSNSLSTGIRSDRAKTRGSQPHRAADNRVGPQ